VSKRTSADNLTSEDARTILGLRLVIVRAANRDSLAWWDDESLTPHARFLLGRIFPMAPPLAARSLPMAPLWELIPIWRREPKKYWQQLERGDYDWSPIAMRYWSERVREQCKATKSFGIAHRHEEWYRGT